MIKEFIHHIIHHEHHEELKDVDEAYQKGYQDALTWVVKHLETEWDCDNQDNIPFYLREMISRKISK